jgi:UDP-N-acetylmuramyl pentapeptide phosphotransferase/UDP-N-acetylglucosamine-1-phosphate transferase
MPILAAPSGFLLALIVLAALLSPSGRRFALDRPNERSLHSRAVPRTGGFAILAGGSVSLAFGAGALWLPLTLAALLAALSFADDLFGLPSALRFVAQLAAAIALVASAHGVWSVESFLLVLALAWTANLYNFMDGADGLAGGMGVIGFGAYAAAAHACGATALVAASAALAGACAAFLIFKFHPARIFMGDVGSIPLGFLAAALGLAGWREGCWPLWFPLLCFGPFAGDATLTLAKRVARREPAWRAHREHYYQRLVRMGFGHRKTAFIEYAAMAGCAAAALAARDAAPLTQAAVFAAASAGLLAIALWIDMRWARHLRRSGNAT